MGFVCVLGSSGFIGSNITARLIENNESFLKIDRNKLDYLADPKISDIIIAAGSASGNTSQIIDGNVNFVEKLAKYFSKETIKKNRKTIHLISSVAVYGTDANHIAKETDDLRNKLSIYGASMLLREKLFEKLARDNDASLNIFRLGHVYGPGSKGYLQVLRDNPSELQNLKINEKSFGRSVIHINDVVSIILQIVKNRRKIDILNLCSGENISPNYIIDSAFYEKSKSEQESFLEPGMYMDNTKLCSLFPNIKFHSFFDKL
tara:strand:- start:2193 stop:2978 length:786 start_codon:yes stop_codon:yes gene_type:complete